MQLLGIDVGGTKCAVLVGTSSGDVVARQEFDANAKRGPEAIIAELVASAKTLLRKYPCEGVGVSIGGPLDARVGVLLGPPNLPGWDFVPLGSILEDALGLPVRVEHDAAACALAEYRWGAGQGCSRLAYLTCATGFGVGFLIDGAPYYGAEGRSMEIGHVRYRDEGPEAFGKVGCFEAYGSARSLSRLAAWMFPERWAEPPEPAALAAMDDPDARAVVAMNARAVGEACALLGDLLVPERILLGSLAAYLGKPWVDAVRTRFVEACRPDIGRICSIEAARLGGRLQDLSAIAAARALGVME